ncbi:MAG: DUF2461 domain-containing protein [Bacteroidota bacterium]
MKNILEFLADLKINNNREWFHANKDRYQVALAEFTTLTGEVLTLLKKADLRLDGLDPKDAIFRIYKDIRFSQDKTPYKTHFGAFLARGGRKSLHSGYYFQIAPGDSFLAAGSFMPDKDQLYAIRQEIAFDTARIRTILAGKKLSGHFSFYEKDRLKTGPKGFPKDHPAMDLLVNRHFILTRDLADDDLHRTDLARAMADDFILTVPFVTFLNEAMEFGGNE